VRYEAFVALHPNSKIVAGNVNVWDGDWLKQFAALISHKPYAYGVHIYIQDWITVSESNKMLERIHGMAGTPIWITEFGVLGGNSKTFTELLSMIKSKRYVERYSAYTNRQYNQWYDLPGVEMIQDGELTSIGKAYAISR
jgi:hypothetical protein